MTPDELKRLLLGGFTIDDITQYGQTSYGNKMNLSQDDIWNGTGTNLQPIRTKQRTPPGLKEGQYASGTYGRVGNTDDESYDEAKLGKLLDGGGRRVDPRAFSPGVKNTLIERQSAGPQPLSNTPFTASEYAGEHARQDREIEKVMQKLQAKNDAEEAGKIGIPPIPSDLYPGSYGSAPRSGNAPSAFVPPQSAPQPQPQSQAQPPSRPGPLDRMQGNLSRKYENLKRIMSGLPPLLDDAREGVQNMRQGVQNVRQGFQDAVQPSLNAVREGVKNDLGPAARGAVQGSLEDGLPAAATQSFGRPAPQPDQQMASAYRSNIKPNDIRRILFGETSDAFNIPDSNGLRLPELRKMPDSPPAPNQRRVPGASDQLIATPSDGSNGLRGINDKFDADWQAGAPARQAAQAQQRVAQAERQTQSIEDVLMGKTANLQGMSNRNIRAYNGGGPTPGAIGDQAMAMNQADIRKQLAGMNPSVDPLSPLQMRGEVDREPDFNSRSPEEIKELLAGKYGPGFEYKAPDRRNGITNPFAGTTTSTLDDNGEVKFNTEYASPDAARRANQELIRQRQGAPAKARLNQLQFTQKQLANALAGKPMDDLPDGLSADAANELVRGAARMYRRGENARNMEMAQEAGFSPDRNPQVREAVAKGAFDNKKAQSDAALRDALAGKKMEFDASEGEKNRASNERVAKIGADAAGSNGGDKMDATRFAAAMQFIDSQLNDPSGAPRKIDPVTRSRLEAQRNRLLQLGPNPLAPQIGDTTQGSLATGGF